MATKTSNGTGHTISGTVMGCTNGVVYGTGHTLSGNIAYVPAWKLFAKAHGILP